MIVRVHHAIGDGLSLVAAFYRMFETASGAPAPPPQMLSATAPAAASEKSSVEKSGAEKSGAAKQKSAAPASLGLVTRGASAAWRSACALIKVIALPVAAGDTRTCVTPTAAASAQKGAASYVWTGERCVVALPPLPLERIKVPALVCNLHFVTY